MFIFHNQMVYIRSGDEKKTLTMSFVTKYSDSWIQCVIVSSRAVSGSLRSVSSCRDSQSQPPRLENPDKSFCQEEGCLSGCTTTTDQTGCSQGEVHWKAAAKGRSQCHTIWGFWSKALYPKPRALRFHLSSNLKYICTPAEICLDCVYVWEVSI